MAEDANVELEVKLTIEPQALAAAFDFLSALPGARVETPVQLRNIYFDTPDFALNHQRMALRVRQKGARFIQTLKTQGEFVDGGHRRMEWEWPVETAELDLDLLAETPLAAQADLHQLQPTFETNFERQVLMVMIPGPAGDTLVEVAIDQGQILAGDAARPLSEIEFELKSGNPAVLRNMAVELARSVPVFLNVISKAEQGYHLAGIDSPWPANGAALDVYGFFRCLSACWLRHQPFPSRDLDLSPIRQAAEEAGLAKSFDDLEQKLSISRRLEPLIADGHLGRVQLALARLREPAKEHGK
jgi:inorganic triphosphatase YgiF